MSTMPSLVLDLHQTGLLLAEARRDRLVDLNLTTLQGHALVLIGMRTGGVTVHELRTNLGISSQRCSHILRTLSEHGYIVRSIDGRDRRFVIVQLTDLGRMAARLVRDAAMDLEERIIKHNPAGEDVLDGLTVANLIWQSRWVGPRRYRVRMPDWS
jgi:DNA-binding MarR family transcriptional regulator